MATQLAALFAFLKPGQETPPGRDRDDLALSADPTYWLYGLLSFCAESCEAKTTETGGEPDKPHAATFVQAQQERAWELHVNSVILTGYSSATNQFPRVREARAEIDFYRTIDQSNTEETPSETGKQIKEQTPASSHQ